MENKIKIGLLAIIAVGIWIQIFQTFNQSTTTQNVSVVSTVNVNDVTPKSTTPIDVNISSINGNKSAFFNEYGNQQFGGAYQYDRIPIHIRK
jgi:hypothetical protein